MNPVIIQAGHANISENCDHGLRGETGAPGEQAYVSNITAMVCGGLKAHGVDAIGADANFNCDPRLLASDYAAVVALHCDGRDSSGFSVNVGNPTEDGAAEASQHLADSLSTAYAAETGLANLDSHFVTDQNISEYYLFRVLSAATPFVLMELGAIASASGQLGPDQLYLYNHADQVASGIVTGVLQALGLDTDPVPSPQPDPVPEPAPNVPPLVSVPLTNLGQAIADLDAFLVGHPDPTIQAVVGMLHAARAALGGE